MSETEVLLKEKIAALEGELKQLKQKGKTLAGKIANRSAQSTQELAAEIEAQRKTALNLEDALSKTVASRLVVRQEKDFRMKYECLKKTVEAYCAAKKIDPVFLKGL